MSQPAAQIAPAEVEVVLRGPVPDRMREYAQTKVAHVTRLSGRDVLHARIVLEQRRNPAISEPSRAEMSLTVAGTPVRASASGADPTEALDRVIDRAERLVVELVNRWNDRSRWLSSERDEQWRRGAVPSTRQYAERAAADREIVRRKTFAIAPTTVEEAVYDMEALEHDFYLFTDAETGAPAVVFRRDDDGYGVAGLPEDAALPPRTEPAPPPPVLDEAGARQRLDVGGEPFVFYIDAESDEGHVLYRRYDGHYGLITPA